MSGHKFFIANVVCVAVVVVVVVVVGVVVVVVVKADHVYLSTSFDRDKYCYICMKSMHIKLYDYKWSM